MSTEFKERLCIFSLAILFGIWQQNWWAGIFMLGFILFLQDLFATLFARFDTLISDHWRAHRFAINDSKEYDAKMKREEAEWAREHGGKS